jgi:hypothetical protein
MRFMILAVLTLLSTSAAFASSGFEGVYKIERITENTGSWKNFWLRPNVEQLQEIFVEEIGNNLYIKHPWPSLQCLQICGWTNSRIQILGRWVLVRHHSRSKYRQT